MKKLLTFLLAIGFMFSIAACDTKPEATEETETETEEAFEDTEEELDQAGDQVEEEMEDTTEEDTTAVE